MNHVILKEITLRNFRGEKERTTSFNAGSTTIRGENALGKSRHFDAFMWLLFGKDKYDRKDFNVRTIVNGEPLHRVECSVEASIEVSGQLLTLKRSYVENWVKPRGQSEEVFKGNITETFWNNVPIQVGEYQRRVNEIVNDTVFKMVTNPMFFPTMKWQDQRDNLFQLAGTISDAEIAASNPEFSALLNRISDKSFADFKREISAMKRKLKEELDGIQPRIDQTQKLMPESIDFSDIERQILGLKLKVENIDKSLQSEADAINIREKEKHEILKKIGELKQSQLSVFHNAMAHESNSAYSANAERRKILYEVQNLESDITDLQRKIDSKTIEVKSWNCQVDNLDKAIETLRKNWHDENNKQYTENESCLICPLYSHECSDLTALEYYKENKSIARNTFNDFKKSTLSQITEKGKNKNVELDNSRNIVNKLMTESKIIADEMQSKYDALSKLKLFLENNPEIHRKDIKKEDLPEYVRISNEISTLESGLEKFESPENSEKQSKNLEKQQLFSEITRLNNLLKNKELIEKYQFEIENLEKRGRELAQMIANYEGQEYAISQFTKVKIEECEKRINNLFTKVTFKLFDYTIDGNEFETCIPLVSGVPFEVANTASQINSGIDIINALTRFHGVSAPIFIDNREAVNEIIHTDSQVINLVVSQDKELVIC